MRWRIGLLQDAADIERQVAKEAAAAAKKHKSTVPTVKTEAQMKAEEQAAAQAVKEASEPPKPHPKPRIRPLSEAKAVETGANFISETFLFSVAASLIFFESWRSGRKEKTRREDVADRLNDLEESEKAARKALVELEREVLQLRAKQASGKPSLAQRILPKEIYEEDKADRGGRPDRPLGLFSRIASLMSSQDKEAQAAKAALKDHLPGPAEKILVESDKALDEKRKQQAIADAETAAVEGKAAK